MQNQLRPDRAHAGSPKVPGKATATEYLDALAGHIDELVAATARGGWDDVGRICRGLADGGHACGCWSVGTAAEQVCDAVNRPEDVLGIKRSLIRLIGSCGRVGLPREVHMPVND